MERAKKRRWVGGRKGKIDKLALTDDRKIDWQGSHRRADGKG
jgi:hypothetical protein